MSWLGLGIVALGLGAASLLYLAFYLRWEAAQTTGMAYYGRTSAGRAALKATMRRRGAPARLVIRALTAVLPAPARIPTFTVRGVSGPPRVSSAEVFERAAAYAPTSQDIFVTTQMRCGTTWMQQIVFEVVTDGRGDLSDAGYGHLYAVSPWIDAVNSVSMEHAPLVGVPAARIIKSHLPVALSPYSPDAKFIYVTRHPAACFASIVDYFRTLNGPLTPSTATLVDWFCSDRMYWSPWPDHVAGWWDWSVSRPNVLFVHFEDMRRDLGRTVDDVAAFLGRRLSPEARARVVEKCGFTYMQAREDQFEMAPPTMFSVAAGRFFAHGTLGRDQDVDEAARRRIVEFCRGQLAGRAYGSATAYDDLKSPAQG